MNRPNPGAGQTDIVGPDAPQSDPEVTASDVAASPGEPAPGQGDLAIQQILAVFVVIGCVVGCLYALWKPRWAFVLVVALFPVKQLIQVFVPALRGVGQAGPNLLVAGIASFALAMRFLRHERPLRPYWNAGTILTLMLYLQTYVGILYTPSREGAIGLVMEGLPYQILLLGIFPLLVNDVADMRRLLTGLMVAGIGITIVILASPGSAVTMGRLTLDVGTTSSYTGRGRSNPLALAEFAGTVTVIAALVRNANATFAYNATRIVAVLLSLGLALMSGSRGQVVGAMLVAVLFYPISRRVKNLRQLLLTGFGLVGITGVIYLAFKLFMSSSMESRWSGKSVSQGLSDRMARAQELLTRWAQDPTAWVFGLGTNAFSSFWSRDSTQTAPYVHNVAVEALGEFGVFGFALFCGAALAAVHATRKLLALYRDEPDMRATVAALAGLAAYSTISALKQGCIYTIPHPFCWWMVLTYLWKRERLRLAESGLNQHVPYGEAIGGQIDPEDARESAAAA